MRYPAASFSAYYTRFYSTVEEELSADLKGILSGALRESYGKGEDIDPMTTKIGERRDIQQQQVEGGRREGPLLSSLSEEEGVEVPSKVNFRNLKFTLTSKPYCTKNGYTQKVINILSGKGITNFAPVQTKAFVLALAVRDVIR